MNSNIVRDLAAIVLIFVIFFGGLYLIDTQKAMTDVFGVTPGVVEGKTPTADQYRQDFFMWSQVVLGVSLILTLMWYGLGEWGLRAHRMGDGSKLLIWVVLLVIELTIVVVAVLSGPPADFNAHVPVLIYLADGVLSFWLATVLFSPLDWKYVPPPAKLLRRW